MSPAQMAANAKALLTKAREFIAEARKAVAGAAGVAASLLALGLLPQPVAGYVSAALGLLATWSVYRAPNKPKAKAAP